MEVLGILLLLAIPIAWSAAFFLVLGARTRIAALEARLARLESQTALRTRAAPTPAQAPVPAPAAEPEEAEPEPVAPTISEPATPPEDLQPAPAPELAWVGPLAAAPSLAGFEERFGTRWVVWVGGLALALGGIFLVRYSIEEGLIGPGLRVFFGALLAAALIAAGEWQRRQERESGVAGIPAAHIPSILTAAGTTVAYATVYAAYALYGFLGPSVAFALLGLVALATLAAALLHGPALAGLGLIGAYVTPVLVASKEPNYWALYVYLAVVSAAAFALARARMWRWLAIAAVTFGALWILPGIGDLRVDAVVPHASYAAVGFALVAVFIVSALLLGPAAEPGYIDDVSSAALIVYLIAAALVTLATQHDPFALAVFTALVAATISIGWRTGAATAAVPAAGILAMMVIGAWAVNINIEALVLPGGPAAGVVPEPSSAATGWHLTLGALLAVLFGGASFLAQGRFERPLIAIMWAAAGVVTPIGLLTALYYRIAGFERSIPFAGIALVLAALYAVATETLTKREPRPGLDAAGAIFATGAIAALALTLTFALEKGWLTVSLALMVPGTAWVAEKRPLPALRFVAAALVLIVLARVWWEPRIVGRDVGTTPLFNWLLYGYGVPALAFWTAGYLLRRRADDVPARMTDAAAILFTVLFGVLEIRHFMTHGEVFRASTGLAELALQVSLGLALASGLERVRGRTRSITHDIGALVIAALALVGIVVGLLFAELPLSTGEPVGGLVINLILLGYGLPAVLAIVLALVTRTTRPLAFRAVAVAVSVALALVYLSLEVTRFYQGPVLSFGPTTDAEQYTYSVVWLAFGVMLLVAGMLLRSQQARLASAAVILITVAKVFVVDMSGLEGVWRALSFIGLGLVLVGIGWLYQRLLFRPRGATSV